MKKLFSVNRSLASHSLRHGLCIAVFGLAFAISPLYADVWHVDGKGDGIYTDILGADAVLKITKSGRPDAWITWKAAPAAHPDVRPTGWGGITIIASYIVIDGINVTGGNDSLSLSRTHWPIPKSPGPTLALTRMAFSSKAGEALRTPSHTTL